MTFEVVEPGDIPQKIKCFKENLAAYEAAKKLLHVGVGRALRVKLDNITAERVRKKAHVYFRFRPFKLRTKKVDGHLYLWIEERQPKKFDVAGIPANKAMAARA